MRILVVGAGSTGGYFGGRLAQAGRDVTFLVRPARARHLREHGLQIVSPHGDAALAPAIVTAPEIAAPFDVVLLAVKAFALDAALDDMAPAVGAGTMIVPTLNGMRHVDALRARFGEPCVLGGVCKIAATVDEQGRIVQLAKFQELAYGELSGETSDRTSRLDAVMQGAGFEARLSPMIEREMWEKWVLLAALGAITCLMRGTVGEIEAAPGGIDFALGVLAECVAIAAASGQPPRDDVVANARATLTAKGSSFASSMYRDLVQGSAIEADQIVGDMLARARRASVSTPLLATAYTHLAVYQNRLSAR
ncbi:MAG: 2-dehydropantoate 2-reductase [Acidisphaera sp.]|nr:2-dehydropantoate 2-reductase [Acidisphaera sp.]